jgi:hypothetical protein
MSYNISKTFRYATILTAIIFIIACTGPAYCQDEGIVMMLQLSPVEGGKVNIEPGVHTYDRDSEVTLKAAPSPGYQFVYWVGNVSESSASTTTVHIDGPKIIIAVFERSKFEIIEAPEQPQISVSGGGLYRSRVERGSDASGATIFPVEEIHFPSTPHNPPVPEGSDLPVPDNEVPEPATILLLAAGIFALNKNHRNRRKCVL